MFNFRDKNEKIGVLLGSICFIPSFLIISAFSAFKNITLGIIAFIISECLWLTSISLCCKSLEIENTKLKKIIERSNNNVKNNNLL